MHDREIIGGVAECMIMKVSDTLEHSIPSLQTWSVNSSSNTILELTYTRIPFVVTRVLHQQVAIKGNPCVCEFSDCIARTVYTPGL